MTINQNLNMEPKKMIKMKKLNRNLKIPVRKMNNLKILERIII